MAARPRLLLSIALAAVSAVVLSACGGSDEDVGEIPPEGAQAMLSALDQAQAARESDPPDCETIANSATTVADTANALPESDVRRAVIEGAENLHDLANSEECGPSTTGAQGPEDDDETTTTTPTTTTTEETTTTEPKDDDNDGGNGGGNGGNGGNGGGNGGNGGGPPPQPPGEGGGLGQGNEGGQPPDTGGTGGGPG
jgi:hypothetical protein